MRACSYCGHEIPKMDRYCPNCGHMHTIPASLDHFELGLIENFKHCVFHKYADFEGRGSRSEYWHFMLGYQLLFATLLFVCALFSYISPESGTLSVGLGLTVLAILSLGLIIPWIAATVRRLHDIGWSGWIALIGLLPFVGLPVLLVIMAWPGQQGVNRFGGPTGTRIITKQMAHEYGLMDATMTTPYTVALVGLMIVLWYFVDKLIML